MADFKTMPTRFLPIVALCLVCCLRGATAAPPPKGTLFPAGGQRGQTVSIVASGKFEPWPVDVWIDGDGIKLVPEAEAGKFRLEIAADAIPGLRWVRLFNAEGTTRPLPLMIGTLPEISEVEPNDRPAQAQAVSSASVTLNGLLNQAADVDVFAVALKAGQILVADLQAHRHLGTAMDAVLQLVSPDGFVLFQNNDTHGLDPQIVYTAERDGTVLVRLFAFPAEPNSTIALSSGGEYVYRLTLTTGAFLEDCFPLALERGKETTITLRGWNLGEAPRTVAVVATTDQNEHTLFDPSAAGLLRLPVVSHAATLEGQPSEGQSPPASQPQPLTIPCVVSGTIGEPRERDVYAVELRKDQPILVRVATHEPGLPLDPVLAITNAASGKEVFRQDDHEKHRDVAATFTPPEDGLYHLAITDLLRQGSPRHVYRLSLTSEKSFQLSVAATEFSVAAGATVEIPVNITRQPGCNEEIEITVEGLPEGTTCPPARSQAADDTAKAVKLQLAAGPTPFHGVLTIKGKSTAPSAPQPVARTTPTATQPFSGLPWLTITARK